MRTTFQPSRRRLLVTTRSRLLFLAIFSCQNAAFCLGCVPCLGHPCQKQPSTNTQSLSLRKTKSGLPVKFWLRRQPVIRERRKISASLSSVVLFPLERMRLMTSDRFWLFQISDISRRANLNLGVVRLRRDAVIHQISQGSFRPATNTSHGVDVR